MNQRRTAHVSCTTAESWHAFYFAKGLLAIQSAGPDRWGCSVYLSLGLSHTPCHVPNVAATRGPANPMLSTGCVLMICQMQAQCTPLLRTLAMHCLQLRHL